MVRAGIPANLLASIRYRDEPNSPRRPTCAWFWACAAFSSGLVMTTLREVRKRVTTAIQNYRVLHSIESSRHSCPGGSYIVTGTPIPLKCVPKLWKKSPCIRMIMVSPARNISTSQAVWYKLDGCGCDKSQLSRRNSCFFISNCRAIQISWLETKLLSFPCFLLSLLTEARYFVT